MNTADNTTAWDPFAPLSTVPMGVYRPKRPASLTEVEHDGLPYYAMNDMDRGAFTKGYVEIGFKDGEWLLCTREDLIPIHSV